MSYLTINDRLNAGFHQSFLDDERFLDLLHTQNVRELYCKILVLNWKEQIIGEIQGLTTDGSVTIDANSKCRRTCSLSMVAVESTLNITDVDGLVGLNRKMNLFIGLKNNVPGYAERYGDIVWFPMGIFVLTSGSISHDVSTNSLSVTAQDKMCLLNGDVGGIFPSPVTFDEYIELDSDGKSVTKKNSILSIIRSSVIEYGGEDAAKVIVLDLPEIADKAMAVDRIETTQIYYVNTKTGETAKRTIEEGPPKGWTTFEELSYSEDNLGTVSVPFTLGATELKKSAGDTVTSVLDSIIEKLGNYEYFYDINGNFVFQEIKNYLNTSYSPYYRLDNGNYEANFSQQPIFYSFVGKNIISAFSNNPDWSNVKNDFVVWGMEDLGNESSRSIKYHVAIDDFDIDYKNYIYNHSSKPWQLAVLDYDREKLEAIKDSAGTIGNFNASETTSYYYKELVDLEANSGSYLDNGEWVWNSKPKYFLDFIDTSEEIGKFSVGNIGRRTVVEVDENVKRMYPKYVPNVKICHQETVVDFLSSIERKETPLEVIDRAVSNYRDKDIPFVLVFDKALSAEELATISKEYPEYATNNFAIKYSQLTSGTGQSGKSAFDVIRNMLFMYSTMNEVINITSIPVYNFEANVKIEVEDIQSNISGFYMIRSINIPLSVEGQMSISAIRATNRI